MKSCASIGNSSLYMSTSPMYDFVTLSFIITVIILCLPPFFFLLLIHAHKKDFSFYCKQLLFEVFYGIPDRESISLLRLSTTCYSGTSLSLLPNILNNLLLYTGMVYFMGMVNNKKKNVFATFCKLKILFKLFYAFYILYIGRKATFSSYAIVSISFIFLDLLQSTSNLSCRIQDYKPVLG